MDERSSRIFFGLCMLVLVWIGVYWMWQPAREQAPTIDFGNRPVVILEDKDQAPAESVVDPVVSEPVNTEPRVNARVNAAQVAQPIVAPSPKLIPPEFTDHVVQPDELMQTIAKHYFGSIDDWAIIAKANPRVDPRKLRPGMVLRIPKDKTNIQGKLVGTQSQPGVIEPHTDTGSKTIEYIVQSGDSLSRISLRIYGSTRHARFIFESNRDILRSMDSISIGQLLKLPPIPTQDDDSNPDE
ncbi:MAG: LysM peptidoglycan-binding domain-containing protein [Phycisphaerales bacterium]|nr:LysM peptidoglycan-binding domain-containing protein [Phycisphaerales bacterium]